MALTGYDPSIINSSIGAVKSAYSNLIQALGDKMQSEFVNGMASKWACVDAQKYFADVFKPNIDKLIESANSVFQSVVDSMNSAGAAWASSTGSAYSNVSFAPIAKTMNIGGIQENIGGVRGIDLADANTVAAKLPGIADAASQALASARSAVSSCGFIGGSQAANLQASLDTIKSKMDSAINTVTTQSKSAIESTVSKYSDTEGKVSQAFTTQG